MGQYWYPINLTKKEFIYPHKLGTGLKLWEQLANHPGTGAALIILTAAMPKVRGGGDLDMDENWHGPERTIPPHNISPGPMPENYPDVAKRTIGRWAGDRIVIVGDYAEDSDIADSPVPASQIYDLCIDKESIEKYPEDYKDINPENLFTDITDDVCRVIEHELNGKYEGDGWREFVYDSDRNEEENDQ